MNVKLLNSI